MRNLLHQVHVADQVVNPARNSTGDVSTRMQILQNRDSIETCASHLFLYSITSEYVFGSYFYRWKDGRANSIQHYLIILIASTQIKRTPSPFFKGKHTAILLYTRKNVRALHQVGMRLLQIVFPKYLFRQWWVSMLFGNQVFVGAQCSLWACSCSWHVVLPSKWYAIFHTIKSTQMVC
jgi:hypothetical protein